MEVATQPQTLTEMRKARSLSLSAAAELLAATLGEDSRTSVSYLYIERHGTSKHNVRKALAKMYECETDTIDAMLDKLPPRPQSSRA